MGAALKVTSVALLSFIYVLITIVNTSRLQSAGELFVCNVRVLYYLWISPRECADQRTLLVRSQPNLRTIVNLTSIITSVFILQKKSEGWSRMPVAIDLGGVYTNCLIWSCLLLYDWKRRDTQIGHDSPIRLGNPDFKFIPFKVWSQC